jgi:hypothetical protein
MLHIVQYIIAFSASQDFSLFHRRLCIPQNIQRFRRRANVQERLNMLRRFLILSQSSRPQRVGSRDWCIAGENRESSWSESEQKVSHAGAPQWGQRL